MPNNWGVYTYGGEEGTEVSSTYEGRHITCMAEELLTDSGSGVATKGHACVFGLVGLQAVGVCLNSGTLTALIAIDTEGIWNLPVYGKDDAGDRVLSPGEPVFIDVADGEISGERNNATQIPFGYLLTEAASGVETISVVKVHWDPRAHWLQDKEKLYFGDGADYTMEWNETFMAIVASAASKIVGEEFAIAAGALADGYGFKETNFNVSGQATQYVAGDSTWLNLGDTFKAMLGGGLVTPHTDGIFMTADAEITGAMVALGGKFTDQMDESDMAWYTLWNLNLTQTFDALYEVNNPALMGYVATPAANQIGSLPFFSTGGGGMKYIMLYSDPA